MWRCPVSLTLKVSLLQGQDQLYKCRYEMMMDEWRREWHAGTGQGTDPNFPIGFVQIGPLGGTRECSTVGLGGDCCRL